MEEGLREILRTSRVEDDLFSHAHRSLILENFQEDGRQRHPLGHSREESSPRTKRRSAPSSSSESSPPAISPTSFEVTSLTSVPMLPTKPTMYSSSPVSLSSSMPLPASSSPPVTTTADTLKSERYSPTRDGLDFNTKVYGVSKDECRSQDIKGTECRSCKNSCQRGGMHEDSCSPRPRPTHRPSPTSHEKRRTYLQPCRLKRRAQSRESPLPRTPEMPSEDSADPHPSMDHLAGTPYRHPRLALKHCRGRKLNEKDSETHITNFPFSSKPFMNNNTNFIDHNDVNSNCEISCANVPSDIRHTSTDLEEDSRRLCSTNNFHSLSPTATDNSLSQEFYARVTENQKSTISDFVSTEVNAVNSCNSPPSDNTDVPSPPPFSMKGLWNALTHEDDMELNELRASYATSFNSVTLPMEGRMIKAEEIGNLYSCFVRRRGMFFLTIPHYKTFSVEDRKKLLRIAIAMSTYITGAQLMDTQSYIWPRRDVPEYSSVPPILSANTLRQLLSNDQFLQLMNFYTSYSPILSDPTVAIVMQVLSLFYPEPGLQDPRVVEQGRHHYCGLLSRYLVDKLGHINGAERFRALILCHQRTRYLTELLQHVELIYTVPKYSHPSSNAALADGIQLVVNTAKETIERLCNEKTPGYIKHFFQEKSVITCTKTVFPPSHISSRREDQMAFIESVLGKLANCDDPKILAEARRILPTDLLQRFLQQFQ